MASTTETTPLLAPSPPPKIQRTVTFSSAIPNIRPHGAMMAASASQAAKTSAPTNLSPQHGPSGHPMLSTIHNQGRRRNSHGSPLAAPPMLASTASKIGPQRTTKNAQKLKLLPNPDLGDEGPDEESGRDVYSQFTRIKDPTARRDAARLGKADRDRLPRVTAYCTANAYRLDGLMRFLKARSKARGANPKQFDECIYSPFNYGRPKHSNSAAVVASSIEGGAKGSAGPVLSYHDRRHSDSDLLADEGTWQREGTNWQRDEALNLESDAATDPSDGAISDRALDSPRPGEQDLDTEVHTAEVFLFEYGTVVIWGMTVAHEERFLKEIARFETEKLAEDDVQTENFNFYYTKEYQARIYNDFISLREKKTYMTKLAISHALAQSVKTSLFEDLLATTIAVTSPLPARLASTGSISLSRRAITKRIGELFILRINIHLQGSVLDSPELMWAEPQLEPVYSAMRSYLEMDQRVGLLMERLNVLGDLLAVLKDQVRTSHGEYLEWIVIVLIAAEILVAAINIVVDLYAGVD